MYSVLFVVKYYAALVSGIIYAWKHSRFKVDAYAVRIAEGLVKIGIRKE